MSTSRSNKLLEPSLISEAFRQSFIKLNPRYMVKNPVMFTVEIGTAVMIGVCAWIAAGETSQGSLAYNIIVTAILFFSVRKFCCTQARGKRQSTSRQFTQNKRRNSGKKN